MISLVKNIKGIMLCVLLAIPAWIIGSRIPIVGSPVFGIIFGMIMTIVIKNKKDIQDGIKFTSKNILQFAVILLGFGMNFSDILKQGKDSLPVILSSITVVLLVAFTLSKLMKLKGNIPTLIGVGSAICGGSAIAATAPVIMAEDEEIAQSISVIFLFNIIAAIVFPTLGGIIGLSNEGFGMFAGTAINDTSSVTAATASWDGMYGGNALDMATIVKLTRTLAIVPITLVLSFWTARQDRSENNNFKLKKVFPRFILFFLLAALITTVFNLDVKIIGWLKEISKFFVIMAMVAIGMNTDIVKLLKTGKKPILLGFVCWISIIVVSLSVQKIIKIF